MYKAFLLSILLCISCGASGEAKPVRSLDASVAADTDDIDRGVLGVRYAVGSDMMRKTHVNVVHVVPGGPSATAGLRKGDQILAIDGVEVSTLSTKGIGPLMKGAPNTVLKLRIKRGADTGSLKIVRGGLSKLPEGEFKSRMMARSTDDERETLITAAAKSIATTHPDTCAAVMSGKFDEAEVALDHAVQGDRESLKPALLYALVLDHNGKGQRAQELIEDLVAARPKWAEAWQALALTCEERGKNQEAIAALKKAVMLVSDKQTEGTIRHHITELMDHAAK